jgi:CBS-domain-containing membrane protein
MSLASLPTSGARQALGAVGVVTFLTALALVDVLTRGLVNLPALVPPFGASVVIVFLTPDSPLGRAWNVVVGHVCCALAAATVLALVPAAPLSVRAALAVSAGGLLMLATRSFHPPGGATALYAVVAERPLGFAMALCPILIGALLLVASRALLDALLATFAAHAKAQRLPRSAVHDLSDAFTGASDAQAISQTVRLG